jgi:hypothetical protein
LGLVAPPLAVFSAAVPLFKVLTHRALPAPVRFVGEMIEGGAKRWGPIFEYLTRRLGGQGGSARAHDPLGRTRHRPALLGPTTLRAGCPPRAFTGSDDVIISAARA